MSKQLPSYCVALVVLIAANVPTVAQTAAQREGWRSHTFPPPLPRLLEFRLQGRDPACASYDGKDCLWGLTETQIDFNRVQPLVCGADHQAKWGVTGYDDPGHWCYQAVRLPKPTILD